MKKRRTKKPVWSKLRLEKELAQAKLELKLERPNKFATNAQKTVTPQKVTPPATKRHHRQPTIRLSRRRRKDAVSPSVIRAGFVRGPPSTTGW